MRYLICTAIALSFCQAALADDDFIGWRSSNFKESVYQFRLTKSALQRAPKWNIQNEYPPLSPRAALAIALTQAKQLRPEVTIWNNSGIHLTPVSTPKQEWIYMVSLEDYSNPIFGVPFKLDIPVYLDGSVIDPFIRKRKRYTPPESILRETDPKQLKEWKQMIEAALAEKKAEQDAAANP